jgi:hypothetical protein
VLVCIAGYRILQEIYFKFSLRYNKDKQQSDAYSAAQLNQTARILTDRYEQKQSLFEPTDTAVIELAEALWNRIIQNKRLDLMVHSPTSRQIDADTMRHSNVREIGSEWICHQSLEELGINQVLAAAGFTEEQIKLAATQIVSRAV